MLPDESGKLLHFALLAALLYAGTAIGTTAADSLFLAHLGAARLPVVYLCMPVIMVLYAPVYSALIGRFGVDRVFPFTLVSLVLGGILFGTAGSLLGEAAPALLYAMKFYAGLWFIALYTLFWNFADAYFSIQDGKRLYGIIAAGGAAGATFGAGLVALLSRFLAPGRFFLLWSVVALAAAPVYSRLVRRHPKMETEEGLGLEQRSAKGLLGSIAGSFRTSPFSVGLAAITFAGVSLTAVLEFLSMGVFASGRSASDLSGFLGDLYAVANALILVVNLFAYNRLVGRLGVGNIALILPAAYVVAFAGFFLHYGLISALLAFYAYQVLLASVEYNNINLLFNALPAAAKRSVRTFIEAISEPLATALAGGLLLAWAVWLGSAYVALAGLLGALAALSLALFVRHTYRGALARNLRRDWLDFSLPPEYWRKLLTDEDRVLLREKAMHSPDRAERIAAADLLGFAADPGAGEALAGLVSKARATEAELLRPAIHRLLHGTDTGSIANVLLWLESERSPEDPELLEEFASGGAVPTRQLRTWSRSRHPSRIAMSAVARWHSSRLEDGELALADVRALLAGGPSDRRWGVRALGGFRHAAHARQLLHFFDEPDAELRLEALRAMHKLASRDTEAILPRVLAMLAEAAPEERKLILSIVERVGAVSPVASLLLAATDFSAAETRQLEGILARFGPRVTATVIQTLRNPAASCRSRVISARTLARLAPAQLDLVAGELMTGELTRAAQSAATLHALCHSQCSTGDGATVLARFYRDAVSEALDFVVQLLGLTGRLSDMDLIQTSLTFGTPKDRANAIEAIEQSCSRSVFTRIQRLLDVGADGAASGTPGGTGLGSLEKLLRQASTSENPIECGAAVVALREFEVPAARDLLHRRIDATDSPRVTAMLGGLLALFDPALRETASGNVLHPIERVAALARAAYFSRARIAALDHIASRADELDPRDGAVLYSPEKPTGYLLVVARGTVEMSHAGSIERLGPGGTCNERVLMGTLTRDERAVAHQCVLLAISGVVVSRAIEVFPALGMSLYQAKVVPVTSK